MTDPEAQLATMIDRFTPAIAARVRACRAALRERLPHAVELVYDNYNALAIGWAPRERTMEGVVSLAIYPRNVLLYFLHGASLADPDGLLSGAGSRGRHVPFIGPETLADPRVEALLARAIDAMPRPFDPAAQGYTVIKSVSAKQRPRRPGEAQ